MFRRVASAARISTTAIGIVAAVLVATVSAGAQTYQGGLRGQARDQGGVLPGVEVVLVNEATTASRAVVTNDAGEYVFTSVLPGVYSVRAALAGFRPEERTGIRIGTQQTVVQDFLLTVGGLTEQVTVTAVTPLVERSSATVASSLDRAALQALPIFGRNAFYASISTPGVIQSGDPQFVRYQDQTNASLLSIGGGPRRANGYLIEGVPTTDFVNRPTIVPSIEAVEELKVQTKTYDVDTGRTVGGVFNTTARSGSNAWHGSGLFVTKPGWSTGQLYFAKRANIPNPPQHYWNYAGSLGGPILKNRTFFWASTDGYEQKSTRNQVVVLPTALERAGDFSQSRNAQGQLIVIYDPLTTRLDPATGQFVRDPFPGNVIPAGRINPVARSVLSSVPLPTDGRSLNGQASLLDGPQNQETVKIDHQWSSRWTTTGIYARQKTREPASAFFGEHGTVAADPGNGLLLRTVNFYALNNVFVPNNSTAIAVRFGYNRFFDSGNNTPEFDAASLGLPASYANALTFNTFPSFTLTGYYQQVGLSNTFGNTGPSHITHSTGSGSVSVSKFAGRHSFKLGGEFRRIAADVLTYGASAGTFTFTQGFTQASPTLASTSAGDSVASFLLGYPASGSVVSATPGNYLIDYYAGYVQDEYRVTPALTLNYGLRYEYEQGVREKHNQFTVGFDRDTAFPIQVPGLTLKGGLLYAGVDGNPTTQGQPLNGAAPRGGFAWSLGQATVLRGGYGFYWAPTQHAGLGEAAIGSRGYTATTTFLASTDDGLTPAGTLSNPFPNGITPPQGNSLGLATGAGSVIDFVDQDSKPGYVQQYSFDLQRELPGGNIVTIGYSGSRSERLSIGGTQDATVNINQLDPQYLSLGSALLQQVPNPFFGNRAFGNLSVSPTISRGQLLRPFPQFDNVLAHRVLAARARYHAVTARWDRRIRNNWGLNANYTFSRLKDSQFGESNQYSARQANPLNNYDLDSEFGYSLLDVPHRFNFNATIALPFGEGQRWLDSGVGGAILGGWSVTVAGRYQGGFPLSVWQASNNSGLLGSTQRPNIVPGVDLATSGTWEERLGAWINSAAFAAAPAFTLGNAPRTLPELRSPGQANTDLSLQKAHRFGGKTLSIRADVLNLFDNPLFVAPVTTFGTANFGQVTSVGGFARSVQFQARLGW